MEGQAKKTQTDRQTDRQAGRQAGIWYWHPIQLPGSHVSYKYYQLLLFYPNNSEGIRNCSYLMEGQAKKVGVLTSDLP
jgi:hypothetical protein